MFGTLKPHACRLGCDRKHEYATFYCGLCKSLGDNFGTLTRALLNYDAVFLALVADGLMETPAEPDRCRCPMLPVVHRPTVRPDSTAMRYAAAMQMMLCDQWLADRAADGKRAAKAARPLLSTRVDTARAILADLGISLAELDGFEDRQARCEVPGETGSRDAAEPTAAALELVFGRMALLPGVTPDAATPEARASLAAFGRRLGSAIYLIDALDDLEKDYSGGAFNPCLAKARRAVRLHISWERIEAAWALLHDDLAALADLAEAIPFRRHREIVESVVNVELRSTARDAARRAHAFARAEHARERKHALRREGGFARRLAASFAALFVFAWVWLSSLPAFAQRGPKSGRDAGASDAGKPPAPPPAKWDPRLPAPRPDATGHPAPPPSSTAPKPAPTSKGGGASPSEPGVPAAPGGSATPGGGGGSGWSNPCSGCSNPCKGCSGCCDTCKDCGGCCKTCDSCKGCTDCNSCCGGKGCCK